MIIFAYILYSRFDINCYFSRLEEQDDRVATWSETTITGLKQIFQRVLVETGYLDAPRATKLNGIWLCQTLEEGIRRNGDEIVLPAFGM